MLSKSDVCKAPGAKSSTHKWRGQLVVSVVLWAVVAVTEVSHGISKRPGELSGTREVCVLPELRPRIMNHRAPSVLQVQGFQNPPPTLAKQKLLLLLGIEQ